MVKYLVNSLYPRVLHPQPTNCRWKKNELQKVLKSKTYLLYTGNYLHSIYTELGIKSHQGMTKAYRRVCIGYVQILPHFIQVS